jgi:hypothetical protein
MIVRGTAVRASTKFLQIAWYDLTHYPREPHGGMETKDVQKVIVS